MGVAYVRISPDASDFAEELEAKVEEATAGAEGSVKVTADAAELDAVLDEVKAKLDELRGEDASVKITADKAEFDAARDEAIDDLAAIDGAKATARLGMDKAAFDASRDEAVDDLAALDDMEASAKLGLNTDDFDAKMDEAEARLEAFRTRSASASLGAAGGSGGGGGGGGGSEGGGSLLGAAILGGSSLLPGVGGAVTGLGLLGGTGALAFGGIGQALSSAYQSSQNVGMTHQQVAAQTFSNSVQVGQAQQSVTQAREQAAEDAVNSDQAIQQADMNLAQVQAQSAEQQVQALQQVGQAQQGVEEATYSLSEANYNMGQAYIQASEAIRQANDQLADAKLGVQSATLAVQQAEYQQRLVDQNAYSTGIQRAQASLAVAQAKQQVKDATDAEKNSQTAANLANKQGIDGSQTVIQAKQGVVQAQYGMTNAVNSYKDAVKNQALTELSTANQVKQAQMQAAQAQRQAAYQQMMDAQSVQNAQKNLSNTIQEQQLQWASMRSTENSAANQFQKDMAKLTPAGRHFVDQVLGMKGAFKQLEAAAQNSTLPGFTTFLDGISKLMPTIQSAVSGMGSAISNAFAGFGKSLESPQAAKTLQGLVKNGMEFANVVLPAFAGFAGALAQLGAQNGAVTGLADILAGIGHGLTGLVDGLKPAIPAFDQIGEAAGKILAALGPAFAQDIGAVANLLAPIARFLNSSAGGPFVKGIAQVIAALVTFQGMMKLLPGFISGPLEKAGKAVMDLLGKPFKAAFNALGGVVKTWAKGASDAFMAWGKSTVTYLSIWAKGTGSTIAGWGKTAGGAIAGWAKSAGGAIAGWGKTAAGAIATWAQSGVQSAAQFAGQFVSRIGAALGVVKQGLENFALNAAASLGNLWRSAISSAASFVAGLGEKLAAAATATWAWIAENAAAGAAYIAENVAEAASATAAFIAENLATLGLGLVIAALVTAIVYLATHWRQAWTDIRTISLWVYNEALLPMFRGIQTAALFMWHNVLDPMWQGVVSGAKWAANALGTAWHGIENAFKIPTNFLITTVYDNGIAKLWNDIVGAVGLGSLKLPVIAALAGGGVIPGYAPGHDTVPAMLSPGEAVLTPGATRAIGGPRVVNALNAAHQPSGGGSGKAGHFAGGGIIGSITSGLGSFFSGLVNGGKLLAALATGNTTAFTNAADKFISTPAAGELAKVMISMPKALVSDLAKGLLTALGLSGGHGTAPGGLSVSSVPAQSGSAAAAQRFALAHLAQFGWGANQMPSLIALWNQESGWNANAVNPSSGAYGIPQALPSAWGHPYALGDYANQILWGLGYIKNRYGTPAAAEGHELGYHWYDSGGYLPPGMTATVNQTGQPEAVLTPQESAAFVAVARQMTSGGAVSGGEGHPQAVFNYFGPQMPSLEQQAEMQRQLALTLSGH